METRTTIRPFMDDEPLLVSPEDSLRSAAGAMVDRGVGAAVVGSTRQPVGLVAERDLVAAVARGMDLDRTHVRRIMTEFVVEAAPDDRVLEAVLTMLDRHIRHLAVREGGRIVGMVSIRDLLRPMIVQALAGDGVSVAAGTARS